jgi:anti-sigma-K factor RskA
MTEDEDIDGLAAEYVLGSLTPAERRDVEAQCRTNAALTGAIAAWERRLAPLSDRVPGVVPPTDTFGRILARTAVVGSGGASAPLRRRSGRRWAVAVGAGTLAACLALATAWFYTRSRPPVHARMDCSRQYKDFWANLDRGKYDRISAEQLAAVSRMALRAYDACQAGDEQDAKSLFDRLQRVNA